MYSIDKRYAIRLMLNVLILWAVVLGAGGALAAELIIIVPYNPAGTTIQQDERWVDVAQQFEVYKENVGMDTQVVTLEFINSAYATEGVDTPERIKRLIYDQARHAGCEYVMLVGDAGVFPIRYQYFGYSSVGLTHWHRSGDDPWYAVDSYGFFPCDAYYANLWDDDDPLKAFDTWDGDGDGFYGEKYYDNYRGIDGNTIHPDVAVGRIPCKNPDEFYRYMVKVMAYEIQSPWVENNALFIGGGFSDSHATKLGIGDFMGGSYNIAYLLGEHGEQWDYTFDGDTLADVDPHDTIIDFVNTNVPKFINYAGHGGPGSLWEPGFYRNDVASLTNAAIPAIVVAPGSCSTARYAQSDADSMPRTVPVTDAPDNDSMAEAFLTDNSDGGVIFIGSIVSNQPPGLYFDQRLFRAVAAGHSTIGACFRQAMEDYIAEYGLDTENCSQWQSIAEWPDSSGGRWYWFPPARFHSVYKVQLFGDPSLRVQGVDMALSHPTVSAEYDRWVNRRHLADHTTSSYNLQVHLTGHQTDGVPIQSCRYNYYYDGELSQWRDGDSFSLYIDLTTHLEGSEDYAILYASMNELGHRSDVMRGAISFDFTLPTSEITTTYGDDDPVVVDGVLAFDADSMRIEATDNLSGVARIDYRFGAGSSYSSAFGSSVEVDFPCFYMTDFEFSYRAVDVAGNEEAWQTTTLRVPSCSNYLDLRARFADLLDAEAGRHMFNLPPSAVDGWVNLGFDPDGDPTNVSFEVSGPFHEDYQAHDWKSIGDSFFNNQTGLWEGFMDTASMGIENGFYWVRAMPEYPLNSFRITAQEEETAPHLVWINNMRNQNEALDVLTLSASANEAWPGDTVTLTVVFHYDGHDEARDVTLRLMLDEGVYQDLIEGDLVRSFDSLKLDEQVVFNVTLKKENLPDLGHLSFRTAMTAQGIPLVVSDNIELYLHKRLIAISGSVRDLKGNPMESDIQLIDKGGTRIESTQEDGRYRFSDVAAGVYKLAVTELPEGYRPVSPVSGVIDIRSDGEDIERHFLAAGADGQAPGFTHLSSFDEAAETGSLQGMVCDRNYGTGVGSVWVSVKDLITGRSLDSTGQWTDDDALIPVADLEDCPTSRPVFDLSETPLHGNLPEDTRCVTFSLDLPAQAALGSGRKAVTVSAEDLAGNRAGQELRSLAIQADFTADITSGPAPLTVNFSNLSTGKVDLCHWAFGDGRDSEDFSGSHTFLTPGTYTVSLMVAGDESNDEANKTAYITVTEPDGGSDVGSGDDDGDGSGGGGGGGCFIHSMAR